MAWITPITSWTSNSYYNATDINRVEENTDYLRTFINSLGYTIPMMTTNFTRTVSSYDDLTSINRLENNLNSIRVNFFTPPGWQSTITWSVETKFTADHANRWENSTLLLYNLAINTQGAFRHAGTFISGQEVLPQI